VLSVSDAELRMLGPPTSRRLADPIAVSLDDLVPPDQFDRHVERSIDLAFVRDLVRAADAEIGRPSIDPVVFFKLQLVLFFEGLRAERQLMRVVADRLSLRWYVGYALTETLPDHSSLTRLRERYGVAVFRRFVEAITEQCGEAGLVWGQELFIDSTDVAATASVDSLHPRFAVEAHLARLFAENGGNGDEDTGGDSRLAHLPVAMTEKAHADLAERAAERHDWIGAAGRPERTTTSSADRRTADFRASPTDPDASPLRPSATGVRLGYHAHDVVDGGKARIILTTLVTPAAVQDNQPALDLLWRTRVRWKLRPRQVIGDTKYGTVQTIVAIEHQRGRAYLPLSTAGRTPGTFSEHDVRYDAAADAYHCPDGKVLRFLSQSDATHRRIYQASAADCRDVHSGSAAQAHRGDGGSAATSTRPIWTGCVATMRRSPTRRRCGSGKCGSNRSSPRPRSGTACAVSDCADGRRSMGQRCSSPQARISSAC
jgi:transposase